VLKNFLRVTASAPCFQRGSKMYKLLSFNVWGLAPTEEAGQVVRITINFDEQKLFCTCHTFEGSIHWNRMDFLSTTMPSVSYEPSDNYLGYELAVETDEGIFQGIILLNSTNAIPP
jgi:hypothetical protein